ncbi:dynamin family protein [Brachyspira pulli]|uniref:dynamin family protein n=1 Tax=Brachyspira pulli TaxID=310721 RepID=UPI003004B792
MANKNKINVLVDRLGKNINFRRTKDKEELIKLLSEDEKIREIKKLEDNLNFVSSILDSKKILNPILAEFDTIVEEDYQKFANSVSLKEEVEAFVKLQALQKELARLISLKDIANKSTVAVGGGFSAGKSQFISSFFADDKIKLPIGVKPVTAIASYIINGDKNIIKGYTYNSGIVDIPIDIYVRLSHDFIKELGFNLKTILPMIAMSTCIPDYKHICFVDTPGYNPSNSGYTNEDFNTAAEYLTNSNALIWLVGLDTNGTIPQSDLKFLDQLNLDNKELYIVANKADLKSNSELEEILDQFEEVLDEYGLNYEGISAYDSRKKMEKSFRKQNLKDFLNTVDRDIVSKEKLANELYSIFQSYKDALDSEKVKNDNVKKLLHSLELDIMETGREVDEQIDERLSILNSFFKVKDIEQSLKDLYELKDKMFDSLNKIFIEVFRTHLDKIPDLEYNKKNEEIEITHKKNNNTKEDINKSENIIKERNQIKRLQTQYSGIIQKITVKVGDEVYDGTTMLILNIDDNYNVYDIFYEDDCNIKSKWNGIVKEIKVNVGDYVRAWQEVAVILV